MTLHLAPTVEDLSEIAEQVWASYLDQGGEQPLLPIGPNAQEEQPNTEVCASVSISGSWHGHVVVECSNEAAKHAAAALLAMELNELTDDDLVDAVGELANIVGGNVKSTLPAACVVSLPQVVMGAGARSRWPGATQVCELLAMWQDELISISVWQSSRNDAGEGGAA
jgi:chemotaxis protein CheX